MGVNETHFEASNVNRARTTSMTFFFILSHFTQKEVKLQKFKKFSVANFMQLLENVIFEWQKIRSRNFFENFTYKIFSVRTSKFCNKNLGSPGFFHVNSFVISNTRVLKSGSYKIGPSTCANLVRCSWVEPAICFFDFGYGSLFRANMWTFSELELEINC